MERFSIIAITPVEPVKDEGAIITHMIECGVVNRVHIRHAGATDDQIRAIIADIPSDMHIRLSLHDHHHLAVGTEIGLHYKGDSPLDADEAIAAEGLTDAIDRNNVGITRSCHSLSEILQSEGYDYVFLSPFFDSISKTGYHGDIDFGDPMLEIAKIFKTPVALGGVCPGKFELLDSNGFGAAAMLGYMWPYADDSRRTIDRRELDRRLDTIRRTVDRLPPLSDLITDCQ